MDFLKFFSQASFQVFTTIIWLQWEWFSSEVHWWFSC